MVIAAHESNSRGGAAYIAHAWPVALFPGLKGAQKGWPRGKALGLGLPRPNPAGAQPCWRPTLLAPRHCWTRHCWTRALQDPGTAGPGHCRTQKGPARDSRQLQGWRTRREEKQIGRWQARSARHLRLLGRRRPGGRRRDCRGRLGSADAVAPTHERTGLAGVLVKNDEVEEEIALHV